MVRSVYLYREIHLSLYYRSLLPPILQSFAHRLAHMHALFAQPNKKILKIKHQAQWKQIKYLNEMRPVPALCPAIARANNADGARCKQRLLIFQPPFAIFLILIGKK